MTAGAQTSQASHLKTVQAEETDDGEPINDVLLLRARPSPLPPRSSSGGCAVLLIGHGGDVPPRTVPPLAVGAGGVWALGIYDQRIPQPAHSLLSGAQSPALLQLPVHVLTRSW